MTATWLMNANDQAHVRHIRLNNRTIEIQQIFCFWINKYEK